MTLSQQVCSIDLAKRLKELGVKQESLFRWDEQENQLLFSHLLRDKLDLYTCAFTVAELGEHILPPFTTSLRDSMDGQANTVWLIDYEDRTFKGDTEADARAKCLIYLLENKLITV